MLIEYIKLKTLKVDNANEIKYICIKITAYISYYENIIIIEK